MPSNPGSVENTQQHIKKFIQNYEIEVCFGGKEFNRAANPREAMSALNKSTGRGKSEKKLYKSGFGMDYNTLLPCLVDDWYACTTI